MRWVWKTKWSRLRTEESGYVLIMSLFVLFIVSLIGIALAVIGIQEFNLSARTKLMDQAYAIAEAGLNRAAVQIRVDRSITITAPTGNNVYGVSGNTPQWEIAPPGQEFGDGAFTVQIWQSDLEPANPAMKVLISTGTVSRSDRTAERTIETRIVASAGGDYDASFDYCIYNGCSDSRATPWPDVEFLAGNFEIDGATPYPDPNDPMTPAGTTPHYPKGALYTRGTIDFPTELASGVRIRGDVIAEDDIYLSNVYGVDALGSGIKITGYDNPLTGEEEQAQVVAGLDGTGNLYVETVSGVLNQQTIDINGYLCAADNVEITSDMNITLSNPISMEGVVAGNDLLVSSSGGMIFGATGGIELGNIFTAGKTDIRSAASGGTRFSLCNAGRDAMGLGVYLETETGGAIGRGGSSCGPIFTEGKVVALTNTNSEIQLGNIYAGTDTGTPSTYLGGTGVDVTARHANIGMGNVVSRGRVNLNIVDTSRVISGVNIRAGTDSSTGTGGVGIDVNATGARIGLSGDLTAQGSIGVEALSLWGNIGKSWSGNDINISLTGLGGYNSGSLSAVGNVSFDALNLVNWNTTLERVKANGNAEVTFRGAIGSGTLKGVEAGGNITLHNYFLLGAFNVQNLEGEDAGSWSGADPSNDSIWCGGNVNLGVFGLTWLNIAEDTEAYGTISKSGLFISGTTHPDVAALRGWTPGVDLPGLPDMAPWTDESGDEIEITVGPEDADMTRLQQTPPIVDQRTLLSIAGLENQTELVEPNWFYFETA
ncbi:MAG: pilus assembly PilX N-terminal domain-containing protein, partial [Actinobacteria bacterium]|nr:pilus assembly PilX N-terminal domain-containing protein [Actinomycetota bacterium]